MKVNLTAPAHVIITFTCRRHFKCIAVLIPRNYCRPTIFVQPSHPLFMHFRYVTLPSVLTRRWSWLECAYIPSRITFLLLIITLAVIHLHNPAGLCEARLTTSQNHRHSAHLFIYLLIYLLTYDVRCQQQALQTCQFIRRSLKLQDMLAFYNFLYLHCHRE